jgi:dolichol-phosphate mannosyltransferase
VNQTLVVVPTYNEAENLEHFLGRLRRHAPDADVLIVDDSSPDGTGVLADRLASADQAVHVLHQPSKDGLGMAYRAGFTWGLERAGYTWYVEMDADGSHDPAELQRLRNAAFGADLVIGSRWVSGGRVVHWPWFRRFISRAGTTYARLLLRLPVRDTTAGFRVLSRRALECLDLDTIASHGYCFQIDVTRRLHRAGLTIREVPVTFVERQRGTSKMTLGIVAEALWRVTLWGMSGSPRR